MVEQESPRSRPSRSIRVVVAWSVAQHAGCDDEGRQHGNGELMEHAACSVDRIEARQHSEQRQGNEEERHAGERHGETLPTWWRRRGRSRWDAPELRRQDGARGFMLQRNNPIERRSRHPTLFPMC